MTRVGWLPYHIKARKRSDLCEGLLDSGIHGEKTSQEWFMLSVVWEHTE